MVSLLSHGQLVTMRRWWNIQGLVSRPQMVWDQLISNVVEREYTSSSHKENIQLPYATKTEPAEISTRQIQLDVNIVLINISNYIIQHGLMSIHQTYTCKGRIILNTWHYI